MNPMLLQIGFFRPQAFTTLVALLLADTPQLLIRAAGFSCLRPPCFGRMLKT
jgi:hypothetical protein